MPQRRIESDAERCCGRDRCHSSGFLLMIMPPSWHPVPAYAPRLCCRRAIHRCSNDGAASIPKFGPEIQNHCTVEGVSGRKPAAIRKFGPEIKNHCTQEGVSGQNPAAIPKFPPSNQESLHTGGHFRSKPSSDSQVYPLKSRIIARWRAFPVENLQRFPSLPPQIKNHCTTEGISGRKPAAIPKLTP